MWKKVQEDMKDERKTWKIEQKKRAKRFAKNYRSRI